MYLIHYYLVIINTITYRRIYMLIQITDIHEEDAFGGTFSNNYIGMIVDTQLAGLTESTVLAGNWVQGGCTRRDTGNKLYFLAFRFNILLDEPK